MTVRRSPTPGRIVKLAGAFLVMASLFSLPDVLASGTVTQATAPATVATVSIPSPSLTQSRAPSIPPTVNTATPLVLDYSPPAKPAAAAAPSKKTVAKTTSAAAPRPAAAPAASKAALVIAVNNSGGQDAINACKGAVLYASALISQHDYCGGTRFYVLKTGSIVTLTGAAVTDGNYRVTSVAQSTVGSTSYAWPSTYALVTCLGGGAVRLWYLQPV